jgi:hypothetical protein
VGRGRFEHNIPIFVEELADEVKWPSAEECQERIGRFYVLFPYVIGTIDCTHHPIRRPRIHQRAFFMIIAPSL